MMHPRQMQISPDGHMPFSVVQRIKKNSGKKRCKTCKCLLSKYNPNDYCFAHVHVGAHKDSLKYDAKKQLKARKQAVKQRKKDKEKACRKLQKKTTKVSKKSTKKR